jgi:hypothetical protein
VTLLLLLLLVGNGISLRASAAVFLLGLCSLLARMGVDRMVMLLLLGVRYLVALLPTAAAAAAI